MVTKVKRERVVTEEVSALRCDRCEATKEDPAPRAGYAPMIPGWAVYYLIKSDPDDRFGSAGHLCPKCAGILPEPRMAP